MLLMLIVKVSVDSSECAMEKKRKGVEVGCVNLTLEWKVGSESEKGKEFPKSRLEKKNRGREREEKIKWGGGNGRKDNREGGWIYRGR